MAELASVVYGTLHGISSSRGSPRGKKGTSGIWVYTVDDRSPPVDRTLWLSRRSHRRQLILLNTNILRSSVATCFMLIFKRLCIPRRTLWRYTNVVLLLLLLFRCGWTFNCCFAINIWTIFIRQQMVYVQWRNNRACKACSARGPSAVGAQNLPEVVCLHCRRTLSGEEGALLEYLHAGPLQPCYATVYVLEKLWKDL